MRRAGSGFTLLELAIAMLVIALLLTSLTVPFAAQLQLRRQEETRQLLAEAREALLGFAAVHGRLPCPASAASRGEESVAPGGEAASGACSHFHDGFLPAAALALAPLDEAGFLRDAWAARIRYAVSGSTEVNGIANALTRAGGLRAATLPGLGAAPHYLIICASGSGANGSSCGAANNQLTRRAAFVLLSTGPNGGAPAEPASDEARNLDGDVVFVLREASVASTNGYDDLLTWVPIGGLVSRMMAAGLLP